MSADKLDAALARIAALEMERSRSNQPQGIDPSRFVTDPVGEMTRAGISHEHITKILVANALGNDAPPELRVLASMGPQATATQALASQVEAMSRRFEEMDKREKLAALRTSFSAVAADKAKYPLLSAAYAKSPSLFNAALDSEGDAAAIAEAEESRLKAIAEAAGYTPPAPPASETPAESTDQSVKVTATAFDNTAPRIPQVPQGAFTPEADAALRAQLSQRYGVQIK